MSRGQDFILSVEDLRTRFGTDRAGATVVDGVSFALKPGLTTALVGESGSGKSATALSVMRLIDPPGRIISGKVLLEGVDLLRASERGDGDNPRRADRHIFRTRSLRSIRLLRSGVRSQKPSSPITTSRRRRRSGKPSNCSPASAYRTRRSVFTTTLTILAAECASAC